MPEYIQIPTRGGYLTFDLDRPALFQDQVFNTKEEAQATAATLDERSLPLMRPTSAGKWAIVVHSQERRAERGVK